MDYNAVAEAIETTDANHSAVHSYIGPNVKSPGLKVGVHYIIRYWSSKSVTQGDNPFWVGEFIGAGESPNALMADVPRAKSMTAAQRYFFRRPNGSVVAAGNFEGALVVDGDVEQRITFYTLLSEPQPNAPRVEVPALRADKAGSVAPAKTPRAPATKEVRQSSAVQSAPASVAEKPRRVREPKFELPKEVDPSIWRPSPPRVLVEYLSAVFRLEQDAQTFAAEQNGEYRTEGFAHTAQVVRQDNPDHLVTFRTAAARYGCTSIYIHRR
jgi:hypothetical protein